jgi:hypothetical protein
MSSDPGVIEDRKVRDRTSMTQPARAEPIKRLFGIGETPIRRKLLMIDPYQ